MALQASGAISLDDIATEFEDSTPHSMSEFYRGGGTVPDAPANSSIPTSGAISFSQFYSAANIIPYAAGTNYTLQAESGWSMWDRFTLGGKWTHFGTIFAAPKGGTITATAGGVSEFSGYARWAVWNNDSQFNKDIATGGHGGGGAPRFSSQTNFDVSGSNNYRGKYYASNNVANANAHWTLYVQSGTE